MPRAISAGPSAVENVKAGNYGDAALQALGLIPGAGLLGKVAGGAKLAMAVPAAAKARKVAKAVEEAVPVAPKATGRRGANAASGDDLFDFSRLSEVPAVAQADLPRYEPPRGVPARVQDMIGNADVRSKMLDVIQRGKEMGGANWYNAEPLRERFVAELGSGGDQAFQHYMDMVAATSPRSDVATNARNASYYYQKLMSGEALPEVGSRNPQPYGHLAQRLHQMNAGRVAGPGWDPLQNPKPASFVQNLVGNQTPVTVDTHAFRLPAILAQDPRFLETAYQSSKDAPKLNVQKAVMSGETNIADVPAAHWQAQPKENEYAALERYYQDLSRDVGLTPAQTQASAWIGGADHTGLKSDESKPFLRFFQDRVYHTARERNMDPQDVLSQFIKGKMPLLSTVPAGLLGAGMMMQPDQQAAPAL